MNNQPDFAAYLHNHWGYPTKEEEAAMMIFKRKARFVEGYNMKTHLIEIIEKYFGNRTKLENQGLKPHFEELKTYVIDNNYIGLILFGTDINKIDLKITDYTNASMKNIKLTVNSICQTLIKEYIKSENVEALCRNTPNFEIYFNVDDY